MNILTFDIEEWFHILDLESTKSIQDWKKYETRIYSNMERIFDLLERTETKATFFCLGWIAESYPDVIKEISSRGYEIGTHSGLHQLVYEQTPNQFEKDLGSSINSIESITGNKVKYFRAPGFSITQKEKWAFEILLRHGIEIDCSIFPARRAHGGFPSYASPVPSIINIRNEKLGSNTHKTNLSSMGERNSIKELPINYINILGKPTIFSGGGYFRILPYPFIKKFTKQSHYVMSYFHPRDFDPNQPMINDLSVIRKIKSYSGLSSASNKVERWLFDFDFIDIGTAAKMIDWKNVPIVNIY